MKKLGPMTKDELIEVVDDLMVDVEGIHKNIATMQKDIATIKTQLSQPAKPTRRARE